MRAKTGRQDRIEVTAFYKFVRLPDHESICDRLRAVCEDQRVKGTVLVAREGINGMLGGLPRQVTAVERFIRQDSRLRDVDVRRSYSDAVPFKRLRVKARAEIVSIRSPESDPLERVGEHVEPEDWNELISDPDVLVIDTRNNFEVEIGTFENAVNPETSSFSEFPEFVERNLDPSVHRRVAMFCTGGIRCEKSTSLLLNRGFENVYHLKGGIINYLERIPERRSKWKGECFVFDERVTLDHRLNKGGYALCYSCHEPVSADAQQLPTYTVGVSCPSCYGKLTPEKRLAAEERQKQIELAAKRGGQHLGPDAIPANRK